MKSIKDLLKLSSWSRQKKRAAALVSTFAASLLISLLYYVILSGFVYFGRDLQLKKENKAMAQYIKEAQTKLSLLEGAANSLSHRDRKIYKSIFGTYPIDNITSSNMQSTNELDIVLSDASEVRTLLDSISSHLNYLGTSSYNIPSKIPVENFSLTQVGASQGKKMNPFYKSVASHNGLDIIALTNTNVIAPGEGRVESVVDREQRSGGKMLTINHLNGYKTRYANLGKIFVHEGEKVKPGQVIASVGSTGMSLAPHLHYEVIFNGRYMNPVNYFFADLGPDDFNSIVILSENMGQSLD